MSTLLEELANWPEPRLGMNEYPHWPYQRPYILSTSGFQKGRQEHTVSLGGRVGGSIAVASLLRTCQSDLEPWVGVN